ncbi:hypothetical protein HMPREF3212_01767 [Citrobacter freundii]|nr:hypothetical protein HMPREF3212_01767 [Citrobacter freundii]
MINRSVILPYVLNPALAQFLLPYLDIIHELLIRYSQCQII